MNHVNSCILHYGSSDELLAFGFRSLKNFAQIWSARPGTVSAVRVLIPSLDPLSMQVVLDVLLMPINVFIA